MLSRGNAHSGGAHGTDRHARYAAASPVLPPHSEDVLETGRTGIPPSRCPAAPGTERQSRDARPREAPPGRPVRSAPAIPLVIMLERLNADVPVTAVASANQASLRFGDAGVVLKDILHIDSDKSVPGMLSRHARTTLFTDDFWMSRTSAPPSSECRARVAPAGIALFPPVSLTPARKPHNGPGSVPASARGTRRSSAARCLSSSPAVVFLARGRKTKLCQAGAAARWAASLLRLWAVRPWRPSRPPIPVFS